MQRRTLVTSIIAVPAAVLAGAAPAKAAGLDTLPDVIDLPPGWRPEGIAVRGVHFYVGSLANGAIYRGDVLTGSGRAFAAGETGRQAVGLEIDARGRVWACGGGGGGAAVYDGHTGARLAEYAFGGTFVNDAVATWNAVYFTDSQQGVLYKVPLGRGGGLPDQSKVESIALPGELGEVGAFNNGIESLPDGRLLIVQSTADRLLTYDPASGMAQRVDLGGASVLRGDGMIRRGPYLYVVRNRLNLVVKFRLGEGGTSATVVKETSDPRFDVPTTAGLFGPFLYAVNARFNTPPTPETTYNIIRVKA